MKYADKMFGGFINGKIMDSAIIGVLCYIGCLIFKFPSALMGFFEKLAEELLLMYPDSL